MNLAEIRKKAANAEVQWGPKPPWAPEPAPPCEPLAPGEPPELCELGGAVEPPADPRQQTEEEFLEALFPEEPGVFDPAAVILRGRQSSALIEDGAVGEEPDAATLELLCFRVAGEEYAIDIMNIKEIIKPREVTEVPRVPAFVRGILSLRGNIIPVFDMRARLGMPAATPSEHERIVVVNRQGSFCGVLVDEVVQVVRLAVAGIEPPPVVLEGIDREFVLGIGQVAGRMLILLDMETVLDVNNR